MGLFKIYVSIYISESVGLFDNADGSGEFFFIGCRDTENPGGKVALLLPVLFCPVTGVRTGAVVLGNAS